MAEKGGLWAFPGLHYFKDDPVDRELFCGRETEIKELSERILAENITVLFGKSGDGKTSLINAGLKEAFRELHYLPVQARIFNTPENISPITALYDSIKSEAAEHKLQLPGDWQKPTLWETFRELRPTEDNALKPIVLILDQFEELFTLMAARPDDQEEFIRQFADLVRGRVPEEVREKVRSQLSKLKSGSQEALQLERFLYGSTSPLVTILISLREDYLAFLDNLGKTIPKVYHSRYRLPSLAIAQARQAILNPPQKDVLGGRKFRIDAEAGEAIIKFLAVQSSASGISEDMVGPPQLQVLCRKLEEQMRKNRRQSIKLEDLGGDKGMRKLLSRFYRDITAKFKLLRLGSGPRRLKGLFGLLRRLQPLHSPRLAVRQLCEDRLITAGGNRNSRHEDEIIREVGVSKADLDTLVASRLLRREPRLQESFYELSHDSLVPSLQTAGGLRQGWIMSLRFGVIAALVVAFFVWGWPYIQGAVTVRNLKSELEAVKNGDITPEQFRFQFERADQLLGDWEKIADIQAEYDVWRLDGLENAILGAAQLATADSFLSVLKVEYSWDEFRISSLEDSLRLRKSLAVEWQYETIVNAQGGRPTDADYQRAKSLLDSASVVLGRSVRFDSLLADLAARRGDTAQAQQIQASIDRAKSATQLQLQEAIEIKFPAGLQVTRYVGDAASKMRIVLENDSRLRGASIRLNGKAIEFVRSGKQGVWQGWAHIPKAVDNVRLKFVITDKEGTKAETTKTILVNRKPSLRSEALQELTAGQVTRMIEKFDFYHGKWDVEWDNPEGKGIIHDFDETFVEKERVVIDHATGLMWQQGGSSERMAYEKAQEYIADLNRRKVGGFDDWRLPTLEEAMSLMEPQRSGNLYIDTIFDQQHRWIWTSDKRTA